MAFISGFLPEGTFSIIQDQVGRVLSKGDMKLGSAFLGSLLLAVWSANGGMKAIIDALNVVYDEKEKRGFIKLNAISLAVTVGGVIGILLSIGLVVVTPVVLSMIGLGSAFDAFIRFGRWPVLGVILLLALAVLYRYAPSSPIAEMAMDLGWKYHRHHNLDDWFRSTLLLLGEFRTLRRNLRLAGRGNCANDVDVDVHDRHFIWR